MSHILDTYKRLRNSGHTEEEALSEVEDFSRPANGDNSDLVTSKDLKIAFFEFKESFDGRFKTIDGRFKTIDDKFHAIDLKFNKIEIKLNLIITGIVIFIGMIAKHLYWG